MDPTWTFLIKNSAEKIWSKKDKEIKVSPPELMRCYRIFVRFLFQLANWEKIQIFKLRKIREKTGFVCLVDNQITRNTPILTRVISNTQLASHFQCHYSRYLWKTSGPYMDPTWLLLLKFNWRAVGRSENLWSGGK